MKKRVLALLSGGILAAASLFMQMPVTAEAVTQKECDFLTEPHIKSYELASIDGQLTVTIDFESEDSNARLLVCAVEKKLEKVKDEYELYPNYHSVWEWVTEGAHDELKLEITGSGTYTFTGLTDGKTYYIYASLIDHHGQPANEDSGEHYDMYLGSSKPDGTSTGKEPSDSDSSSCAPSDGDSKEETVSYEDEVADRIQTAPSGSTIAMEKGITTLSNSTMKELLAKGDVSLKLEFTYEGKEYVIIIPAGKALDNDIPYYGPLYLAQHFGNKAGSNASAASGTGDTYEVKSGDCLSKIAAANNMTLKQLLEKNPQIKDPNKITAGQKINR